MMLDNTGFVIGLIVIFSLVIGSFLSMLVYRIPIILFRSWYQECQLFLKEYIPKKHQQQTMNIALPRSHCPACEHPLKWYYNIPLLGYIIQRGRCRFCQQRIPLRYPIIEILSVILPLICLWQFGLSFKFYLSVIFSWCIILQSYIDLAHQIIPDQITIPMIWLGLCLNLENTFTDIHSAVIGAVAGYLFLWIFAKLFHLITKKEGMGHGDFKLLSMIGAWVGWQFLPIVILLSSFTGAILGIIILLIKKQHKNTPFPFGPYLAVAGWLTLLFGQTIWGWYMELLG